MTLLPAAVCLFSVVVLLRAVVSGDTRTQAIAKTCASASFVVFAWMAGVLAAGPAGLAVFAALVVGALGDVALIGKDRTSMMAGIGLFLLAHVGYIYAFRSFGTSPLSVMGTICVMIAPGWWVLEWVGDAKGLRNAVILYVVIISLMVAMAVGCSVLSGTDEGPWRVGLLASAMLFYASDLCVARERFVVSEPRNRLVGLPLYYAAQLGFAWFTAMSMWPSDAVNFTPGSPLLPP